MKYTHRIKPATRSKTLLSHKGAEASRYCAVELTMFSERSARESTPILSATGSRLILATSTGIRCGRSSAKFFRSRNTGGSPNLRKRVNSTTTVRTSAMIASGRDGLQRRIFSCIMRCTAGISTTANSALTYTSSSTASSRHASSSASTSATANRMWPRTATDCRLRSAAIGSTGFGEDRVHAPRVLTGDNG